MKVSPKSFVLAIGILLTVLAFVYFLWHKPIFKKPLKNNTYWSNSTGSEEAMIRMRDKVIQVKKYLAVNRVNNDRCFLLDMRIPSGQNRFFVYNLHTNSVEIAGLVTHGSGLKNFSGVPVFSNTPNSKCTSLGKYKIGKSYFGKFGLAYKLYGLDKTNSRAFDRFVVLHAHQCVPNGEVYPLAICESWGCPTVSPAFLQQLKTCIEGSSKPIILWIYY